MKEEWCKCELWNAPDVSVQIKKKKCASVQSPSMITLELFILLIFFASFYPLILRNNFLQKKNLATHSFSIDLNFVSAFSYEIWIRIQFCKNNNKLNATACHRMMVWHICKSQCKYLNPKKNVLYVFCFFFEKKMVNAFKSAMIIKISFRKCNPLFI